MYVCVVLSSGLRRLHYFSFGGKAGLICMYFCFHVKDEKAGSFEYSTDPQQRGYMSQHDMIYITLMTADLQVSAAPAHYRQSTPIMICDGNWQI
jgi:hypothetical protein